MFSELMIKSKKVAFSDGVRPASVFVEQGKIVTILPYDSEPRSQNTVDLGNTALLPGLVDTHVHVHEPDVVHPEGFETATRAAAAGGITTILDMPNTNSPMTATVEALRAKEDIARKKVFVDVGFWGAMTASNQADRAELLREGVFGFKCYMPDPGPSAPPQPDGLNAALSELKALNGLTIFHAEDPLILAQAPEPKDSSYAEFLRSKPSLAEVVAVTRIIEFSRATGARVHIVHLCAAEALPLIAQAKVDGVKITAETCPHYLFFSDVDIPEGATVLKCAPPIRNSANREALWGGLEDGTIDCVVSDHAPWTAEHKSLKGGDFRTAGEGISSLQLIVPAMWTKAQERGHGLDSLARWMGTNTANLAGLKQKGRIEVGADADLVAFDAEATFVVDPELLEHRVPRTAYAGRELRGVVLRTWLRGTEVGTTPRGELLNSKVNGI